MSRFLHILLLLVMVAVPTAITIESAVGWFLLGPVLWFLADCALSGRPFTLIEAPGGFFSNFVNELTISRIRLGEASIFGVRPGVLWNQTGAVGGGEVIDEIFKAEQSLATKQYYFMEISGNNQVDTCDGATDVAIGVLQNKPGSGQNATVRIHGRSKVNSDEALTAGWFVGPAADGQADRKIVGTDETEYYSGVVVRGTGAAGEIGEILVLTPVIAES